MASYDPSEESVSIKKKLTNLEHLSFYVYHFFSTILQDNLCISE